MHFRAADRRPETERDRGAELVGSGGSGGASSRPPLGTTNKWAVLALAGAGVFMTTLDASIVNISLPSIARSFGTELGGPVEWVVIGYLVVIAALLLSFGRLADLIGRKAVFIVGLAVFTTGSALSGAAPSLLALIGARAIQGIGGALLFAVNLAMISTAFPARERGRALGINSVIVALGISTGPTVGGLITQNLTWRWIFYINVPIGIVAVLLTLRYLRQPRSEGRSHFDPLGAICFGIGLAALTLGLSFGEEWGWSSAQLIASIVIALVSLVAAVVVEGRVHDPVVDLALVRQRVFASASVSFILCQLALFAVSFLMPFYFEELRGFSAEQSGLLLTPLSLSLGVVAPISGSLADRIGSRWLSPGGLALATLGLVFLSQLGPNSSTWSIVWRLVVAGVGQGIFQAPNTRALMGAAPRSKQGQASGLLATERVVGQSVSVAIAGAIFTSLGGAAAGLALSSGTVLAPGDLAALRSIFVSGFQAAFLACAAFAAIGVLTAFVRGNEAGFEEPEAARQLSPAAVSDGRGD